MGRFSSFLFVSVLLLLFKTPLFCQELSLSDIKAQLDTMFSGLDKSKVPTGFLWDTAVNLVERESYDGSCLTDSNYVTMPVLCDMLYSINSACVDSDTLFAHAGIKRIKRNSTSNHQLVGILFQPYNFITEYALTDNLIVYSNDRVSDSYIGGVWQNPYDESVLFGYAIGDASKVDINTTFIVSNIDSLSTQTFQSVMFDPGDGGGFRSVSLGGSVFASYNDSGYHETKMKVTVGGHEYQSHGLIFVAPSQGGTNVHHHCPHNHGNMPRIVFFDTTAVYGGVQYKARVSYAPSSGFDNPMIIAEGFDPWQLYDSEEKLHTYVGFTSYYDIACDTCACNAFHGYDLFYVDWYETGADIRANAEVLKSIIRWVNQNKTTSNKNIVLGQSMGGLIARYALRDMELHNERHDTRLFISHDAPHLGANVSPGLMYLYWDIMDISNNVMIDAGAYIFEQMDALQELRALGGHQSVKQMLPLYLNSTLSYSSLQYATLRNAAAMQELPKGDVGSRIENVAIVNGGYWDITDCCADGNKLFFAQAKLTVTSFAVCYPLLVALTGERFSILDYWFRGPYTFNFEWSVFPYTSNNSLIYSISLTTKKRFSWKGPKLFTLYSKTRNSPSSGMPYDGVSSSYYCVNDEGSIVSFDILDLSALNLQYAKKIPFIPTASALLMSQQSDYSRDFYLNKPDPYTDTPFSAYILNQNASNHISFFNGISSWLEEISETEIVGPDLAFSGDVYSINPGYYSSSFNLSLGDSDNLSISNTGGVLSGTGTGLATVYAKDNAAGYAITKKKDILVGLPEMVLSYEVGGNDVYTVTAEYLYEEKQEFIEDHNLEDSLFFYWKLTVDGVPKDSVVVHTRSYSFSFDYNETNAVIEFHVASRGHIGPTSSLNVNKQYPYTQNVIAANLKRPGMVIYVSILGFPSPPYLSFKRNEIISYTGSDPTHIVVLGKSFPLYIEYLGDDTFYKYPLFNDTDVDSYATSVTPATSPLLLDIALWSSGTLIQTTTIPIFYGWP